jgi:hypothetical protein
MFWPFPRAFRGSPHPSGLATRERSATEFDTSARWRRFLAWIFSAMFSGEWYIHSRGGFVILVLEALGLKKGISKAHTNLTIHGMSC